MDQHIYMSVTLTAVWPWVGVHDLVVAWVVGKLERWNGVLFSCEGLC